MLILILMESKTYGIYYNLYLRLAEPDMFPMLLKYLTQMIRQCQNKLYTYRINNITLCYMCAIGNISVRLMAAVYHKNIM